MPYIPKEERERNYMLPETSGQCAFQLTSKVLDYLDEKKRQNNQQTNRFEDYALAVGILELTKLELWKRMISPYEEKKCKLNGDVYPREG